MDVLHVLGLADGQCVVIYCTQILCSKKQPHSGLPRKQKQKIIKKNTRKKQNFPNQISFEVNLCCFLPALSDVPREAALETVLVPARRRRSCVFCAAAVEKPGSTTA